MSELGTTDDADGFIWLDLVSGFGGAPNLFKTLGPVCPGLTVDMLADVTTPDNEPVTISFDGGRNRKASAFGVAARRRDEHLKRGDAQVAGELAFSPVELLASDRWLLTCWHPTRVFAGADAVGEESPCDPTELVVAVKRRWASGNWRSPGELGLLVMHELSLGYNDARRELEHWLEDWELGLYTDATDFGEHELGRVWGSMAVLRDWLKPLNRVGLADDLGRAWLQTSDVELATAVDDRIDRALHGLKELGSSLRASFAILQVRQHDRQREAVEANQRRVELIAAAFLVPSLIVGLYGANTWIPGQGSHGGFWVMLVALIVLTGAAIYVIRRLQAASRIEDEAVREHRELLRLQIQRDIE